MTGPLGLCNQISMPELITSNHGAGIKTNVGLLLLLVVVVVVVAVVVVVFSSIIITYQTLTLVLGALTLNCIRQSYLCNHH